MHNSSSLPRTLPTTNSSLLRAAAVGADLDPFPLQVLPSPPLAQSKQHAKHAWHHAATTTITAEMQRLRPSGLWDRTIAVAFRFREPSLVDGSTRALVPYIFSEGYLRSGLSSTAEQIPDERVARVLLTFFYYRWSLAVSRNHERTQGQPRRLVESDQNNLEVDGR